MTVSGELSQQEYPALEALWRADSLVLSEQTHSISVSDSSSPSSCLILPSSGKTKKKVLLVSAGFVFGRHCALQLWVTEEAVVSWLLLHGDRHSTVFIRKEPLRLVVLRPKGCVPMAAGKRNTAIYLWEKHEGPVTLLVGSKDERRRPGSGC